MNKKKVPPVVPQMSAEEIMGHIVFSGSYHRIGSHSFIDWGLVNLVGAIEETKKPVDPNEKDDKSWVVYYFVSHDIYLKFTGYVDSYGHGDSYSILPTIVRPQEKTIIDFVKIKK